MLRTWCKCATVHGHLQRHWTAHSTQVSIKQHRSRLASPVFFYSMLDNFFQIQYCGWQIFTNLFNSCWFFKDLIVFTMSKYANWLIGLVLWLEFCERPFDFTFFWVSDYLPGLICSLLFNAALKQNIFMPSREWSYYRNAPRLTDNGKKNSLFFFPLSHPWTIGEESMISSFSTARTFFIYPEVWKASGFPPKLPG